MNAHLTVEILASPEKVVRFSPADAIIPYREYDDDYRPQSPIESSLSPERTPSPTISGTTDSSNGPATPPVYTDSDQPSKALLDIQKKGWNVRDGKINPQWDTIPATITLVKRIDVYISGLPQAIVVESMGHISIGKLFRAIKKSLFEPSYSTDSNYYHHQQQGQPLLLTNIIPRRGGCGWTITVT